MLQNYLQTALRNLRRNGRYLMINVLGLGFALGFCILSWLNYRFANTYDHWHRDAARIGRVEMKKASNGEWYGVCPGQLATAAVADLPGVESSLRYDLRSTVVKSGESVYNEHLYFADAHFFSFFDFPALAGVADLNDRSKVVIDEEMAEKYFGRENPVGKTLIFYADSDKKLPLTVGAVLKNIPLNSSVRFHFITHPDNAWEGDQRTDFNSWERAVGAVFIKLKSEADLPAVRAGLQAYVAPRKTARPDWVVSEFGLEPLRQISLTSRQLRSNMLWQGLPPAAVWGNVILAALLLLTAVLNFSNMTISISNRRLREMGVRKVLGGTRFQLMRQMLTEAFIVVAMATGVGMAMAYPVVDWYNETWIFTDLKVDFRDPGLIAFLALATTATTLLAGSYPAFYISGLRPARIFRGGAIFGGKNLFSRTMLGLQMAISVLAMVVGLGFAHNAERNRSADIGFEYKPLLQAWLPKTGDFQVFENAVRDIPGIEQTAAAFHLPGFGYSRAEFNFREQLQESNIYEIGNGVSQLMNLRLIAGEWPVPAGDTSVSSEILLNEKLARRMGAENSELIGQTLRIQDRDYRVSGIVADFMTDTPFNDIAPSVLKTIPTANCRRAVIKTASLEQQGQIMAAIEKKWRQTFPFTPLNVGYQSEMLKEAIEVSDNIARTMSVLAGVAVLLSIIGLFSLVSLEALRRMRELAIRRVVGASAGHITWILHRNYMVVFIVALVVGCAGGWAFGKSLMDSIFQTNYGVPLSAMLTSCIGMIVFAVSTIGLKIWQTLRTNPADVLRND